MSVDYTYDTKLNIRNILKKQSIFAFSLVKMKNSAKRRDYNTLLKVVFGYKKRTYNGSWFGKLDLE